jgi:hypothetical protein
MNSEVLQRVKEERNILNTIKRRKADWMDRVLRWNCLLKHIIEAKLEATGRRGRTRKKLLNVITETRIYWKLKEVALHFTRWRTRFGGGCVPVITEITWWWLW